MCRQWRFQHSGSTRAFDYALYCRMWACMLCMFVLPPTSLIKVVNSGCFHRGLSVFIYFRFMLAIRMQFAGGVNQKISFATTARSLLGLIHWSPSCPLQLSIFQFNSYQIECFFEAMGLHRTFGFQSNGQYPFENNFKRTINCPITRAHMNEPKTQRINWRYHCSVTCIT